MKRGLISWDKTQLPPSAFEARLEVINRQCAQFDVPAIVAYSDVWRSNDVRYISNYMPYWNRALTVVPRGEKPILLCSLSPRVYPWIKSVTIHEVIVASPSLPVQIAKLCTERGWTRVGLLDVEGLPNDLYTQLQAGSVQIVDIPRAEVHPGVADSELSMYRQCAQLARRVLEEQIAHGVVGLRDYEFVGRLERSFRRAGAEDLVVLVSDGRTVPLPASGKQVGPHSSATVALELNGHWAKLSRNVAGITSTLPPQAGASVHLEKLSGPYTWEGICSLDEAAGAVVALQVEINSGGQRRYFGDTVLQGHGGPELL
jgi:hypothetical protein